MSAIPAVQVATDSVYAFDAWAWKTEQFRTFDEHDPNPDPENPSSPFPTDKLYLRAMHELWHGVPGQLDPLKFMLVEKSRQMIQTWDQVGNHLHLCQYKPRRRVLVASIGEDESYELLLRIWFSYEAQDDWVKERHPARLVGNKIIWGNGSVASALPKGKHKARSLVCSAFLFDEMGFNVLAESLFMAAIPGLVGQGLRGGRMTAVSTAEPGFFQKCVEGVKKNCGGQSIELMRGVNVWLGQQTEELGAPFSCVRLHYSADPDPYVKAKVAQARGHYKSLGKMPWFFKEYEIDYGAVSGELVWPQLSKDLHGIEPFPIPEEWRKIRIIDPGYRNACAVNWMAISPPGWRGCVDEDGVKLPVNVVYRELHLKRKTVPQVYRLMDEASQGETYVATLIDPSSDVHKGNEDAGKSTYEQFQDLGVKRLIKANNTVIPGLDEVRRRLVVYGQSTALLIFNNLTHTWEESTAYRYRENTDSYLAVHDESEEVIKKNDHHADNIRYGCQYELLPEKKPKDKAVPGTWAWVRARAREMSKRKTNRDQWAGAVNWR